MLARLRAEARSDGTELRFQRLLENAQDLIYRFRVAPVRGFDYINSACLAITGHGPEEFYKDPGLPLKIVHPDDRPLVSESQQPTPDTLQRAILLRWVHPDGRIVWAEHRRVPILDREGRVIAIEGVGRDITANREIQNRLTESEGQLRRLAARLNSAREAERAHLSRELHDELGQALTSIKIDLTLTLRDLIPLGVTPDQIDRMQSVVGNVDLATETVRRLASALRPPALDHLGLAAAIELEGAAVARRTGLRCRVSGTLRTTGLTPEQTTAMFRIVQEALTNVIRHAGASAIRVVMKQTLRIISVMVHDNGRGITARALEDPASIGLLGMRERAELIGATLTIGARPGKGTTVGITIPTDRPRGMDRA